MTILTDEVANFILLSSSYGIGLFISIGRERVQPIHDCRSNALPDYSNHYSNNLIRIMIRIVFDYEYVEECRDTA